MIRPGPVARAVGANGCTPWLSYPSAAHSYACKEMICASLMCLQLEPNPGYGIAMLRAAAEAQLDAGVRQVAAINFKNYVKRSWEAVEARFQEQGQQLMGVQFETLLRRELPYEPDHCMISRQRSWLRHGARSLAACMAWTRTHAHAATRTPHRNLHARPCAQKLLVCCLFGLQPSSSSSSLMRTSRSSVTTCWRRSCGERAGTRLCAAACRHMPHASTPRHGQCVRRVLVWPW